MGIVQNFDGPASVQRAHYGDTPFVAARVGSILPGGRASGIPGITFNKQTFNPAAGGSTIDTLFTSPAKGGELIIVSYVGLGATNFGASRPSTSFQRLNSSGSPVAFTLFNLNLGSPSVAVFAWGIAQMQAGDKGCRFGVGATAAAGVGQLVLAVGPSFTAIDTPIGAINIGSNTAVQTSSAGSGVAQKGIGFFALVMDAGTTNNSFSVPALSINEAGPIGFYYNAGVSALCPQIGIADATGNSGASIVAHTAESASTGVSISQCLAYH